MQSQCDPLNGRIKLQACGTFIVNRYDMNLWQDRSDSHIAALCGAAKLSILKLALKASIIPPNRSVIG